MAFKASKTRKRKEAAPMGRGSPIYPSAAIEIWYKREINAVAKEMIKEYKKELYSDFNVKSVKAYFAADASASYTFERTLNSLRQRWTNIFKGFADTIAPVFVDKTEKAATSATLRSLSTTGLKEPRASYTESVRNTLEAASNYNNTLVAGISEEIHEKIFGAVMRSLTSPNPEEQGQTGIENALKEIGGFSEKRIELIVVDQTSKLYSSLSDDRMRENGCEEFEWMHSSAGKQPRHNHVEKNGQIFKLDDPRLWEGPKADQGPPGWAIRCRCRRIPIFR